MCLEIKAINDYLDCYQDESLKFSTIYVDKKTGKKYTRTFFKNLSDGKKFYYRVQLLSKKNNEFVLQRDSGTLNVPNNFKELKQNLPFHTCVKIFNISVFRKNVDLKFFCLEKRDDRYKKRLPVRHLLRNILDMTIVKKVLQLYNIDKIKMNSLQGINDSSVEAKFQIIDSLLKKNTYCQLVSCKNNQAISLLDVFYKKLNTKIDVLDKSTERWKLIETCVKNTHSNHHNDYSIKINEIFVVKRWEDRKGFLGKLGNKKLLWHGTRISNVASILEKGFELDPNIAHKAFSLMFGKGIYFTNTVSKAANYCGTGTASRNKIGVLFLAEVALGKMKVTLEALPNLTQLPEGHHSVFAKGLLTPHRNFKQKVLYNVELAYGELLQIPSRNSQLKHDEFVVYDPKQIKIRYMVLVDFKYKK
ncbi:poly [ADP-ribose] polymerase-like [Cotesia glomerata]|uniref:poly [ADP-ribose] polymerase-like n=1 Tax=Cotesia glomerata TaxID=32391 RepID=UPI001D01C6CC|nr:poly [ADP-ribose] polymerase-like [Cotesia glomerata]